MDRPIISLCLPTNGIIEWVFPVLDSIYNQNVDKKLYEVIVTNNGGNSEFHKQMCEYAKKYNNLIYKKTDVYMFYNQLEALKIANGMYLKFVNHRAVLIDGALENIINVIQNNIQEKPVIFFSNGTLEHSKYKLKSFDEFVCKLGRYASWTTGVGIWKEDYDKLPQNIHVDKISPHSCILFAERNKNSYLIDNSVFSQELEKSHEKKGTYDLFKAFAVEELLITMNLYIDGNISANTLKEVKKDYKAFVCDLYYQFIIRKKKCSYDLSGFDNAMGIFFSKKEIIVGAYKLVIKKIINKFRRG